MLVVNFDRRGAWSSLCPDLRRFIQEERQFHPECNALLLRRRYPDPSPMQLAQRTERTIRLTCKASLRVQQRLTMAHDYETHDTPSPSGNTSRLPVSWNSL
jgi:hypothetical protein